MTEREQTRLIREYVRDGRIRTTAGLTELLAILKTLAHTGA